MGATVSSLDFVKCEGCEQEAVTMDNPDGVYLCQDCYDGCVEDSLAAVKGECVLKPGKAGWREWIFVSVIVLLAAMVVGLCVYKDAEKQGYMKIERIIEQPKGK